MVPFEGGCADGHLLPVNPMQATGKLPGRVFVEHPLHGDSLYEGDSERGAYVSQLTYYPKYKQPRFRRRAR